MIIDIQHISGQLLTVLVPDGGTVADLRTELDRLLGCQGCRLIGDEELDERMPLAGDGLPRMLRQTLVFPAQGRSCQTMGGWALHSAPTIAAAAQVMRSSPHMEAFTTHSRSFPPEAALPIMQALPRLSRLTSLTLQVTGLLLTAALRLPELRHLSAVYSTGTEGLEAHLRSVVETVRASTRLLSLELSPGSRLVVDRHTDLSDLIAAAGDHPSLTALALSRCAALAAPDNPALTKALAATSTLTSLGLDRSCRDSAGLLAVARALAGNTTLRSLRVQEPACDNAGVGGLCDAAGGHPALASLVLSVERSYDPHATVSPLGSALARSASLRTVSLRLPARRGGPSGGQTAGLGDVFAGAAASPGLTSLGVSGEWWRLDDSQGEIAGLGEMLRRCTGLQELVLMSPCIDGAAAQGLASAFGAGPPCLRKLKLSFNAMALAEGDPSGRVGRVVESLRHCRALELLSIGGAHDFGAGELEALTAVVSECARLDTLRLGSPARLGGSPEARQALFEAVASSPSLAEVDLGSVDKRAEGVGGMAGLVGAVTAGRSGVLRSIAMQSRALARVTEWGALAALLTSVQSLACIGPSMFRPSPSDDEGQRSLLEAVEAHRPIQALGLPMAGLPPALQAALLSSRQRYQSARSRWTQRRGGLLVLWRAATQHAAIEAMLAAPGV